MKYHQFSSVQFSHSVTFNSLWPHGLQHSRPPYPSSTPEACSNSCPLSQWCQPPISSSVVPFSSCLQSFPASGSFQMSQFFPSGGQSTGVSTSASVLPMNIQDWFPLGWTGWIALQSKGLSRVFSSTTVQKHQFFGAQLSLQSNFHIRTWLLEVWPEIKKGLEVGLILPSRMDVEHLPENIQDRFPLRLSGLISLHSKGLSRITQTKGEKWKQWQVLFS